MATPRSRAATVALFVVLSIVGAACAGETQLEPLLGPETTAPTTTEDTSTTNPTAPVSLAPATVSTPADRLDEAIEITWIGGSEVENDGRSLVTAVSARLPLLDERPLELVADTSIAPTPDVIAASVRAAADRNVDGIIVSLNPAWATWTGHLDCLGITPAHTFYACVLEPPDDADVAAGLVADIEHLIDAIVGTGLPAYVYVMPHSQESLANPELTDRLEFAEGILGSLDPDLPHIRYIGHYLSRDVVALHEGAEFFDMVHPGDLGVDVLADHFAPDFASFFATALP